MRKTSDRLILCVVTWPISGLMKSGVSRLSIAQWVATFISSIWFKIITSHYIFTGWIIYINIFEMIIIFLTIFCVFSCKNSLQNKRRAKLSLRCQTYSWTKVIPPMRIQGVYVQALSYGQWAMKVYHYSKKRKKKKIKKKSEQNAD